MNVAPSSGATKSCFRDIYHWWYFFFICVMINKTFSELNPNFTISHVNDGHMDYKDRPSLMRLDLWFHKDIILSTLKQVVLSFSMLCNFMCPLLLQSFSKKDLFSRWISQCEVVSIFVFLSRAKNGCCSVSVYHVIRQKVWHFRFT